ncbi:MAG: carbamoyltransferase C-terminal domain-containing protein [Acidimicrobiales bacterium]
MSVVLGINGAFHDPAAALVVDGSVVAATEEARIGRSVPGAGVVPAATWELPIEAVRWSIDAAGLDPTAIDAIAYCYDPDLLGPRHDADLSRDGWDDLRSPPPARAPRFLAAAIPALATVPCFQVPHHIAHAASAHAASPFGSSATMVVGGRGERTSYLAGHARQGHLEVLAHARLPNSLGLVFEDLAAHLGHRRRADEHKVLALAASGVPRHLDRLRDLVRSDGRGGFSTARIRWSDLCPRGAGDGTLDRAHADLAASVQARLEEVLLDLAWWLHDETGEEALTLAGSIALNWVANSRLHEDGPFRDVWVQPAAGDGGTALGAAYHVAVELGDEPRPMCSASLGRGWTDDAIEAELRRAGLAYHRAGDVAADAARLLADDALVGWFQGRSEFGPRALGHRSLLAHPGRPANADRLQQVTGRARSQPVGPMVLEERAPELFDRGPLPSPFMLFTHHVRPTWRDRMPAAVEADDTTRARTVSEAADPLVHRLLRSFEGLTGLPLVAGTSLDTPHRPVVDTPGDAIECLRSAPIDALVLGPWIVRRGLGR